MIYENARITKGETWDVVLWTVDTAEHKIASFPTLPEAAVFVKKHVSREYLNRLRFEYPGVCHYATNTEMAEHLVRQNTTLLKLGEEVQKLQVATGNLVYAVQRIQEDLPHFERKSWA